MCPKLMNVSREASEKAADSEARGKAEQEAQEKPEVEPWKECARDLCPFRGGDSLGRDTLRTERSRWTGSHPLLQMQQYLGNQAVLRQLESGLNPGSIGGSSPLQHIASIAGNQGVAMRLQAKLAVNAPGDQYEQEADRIAEHVMRMPAPNAQASAPAMCRSAASVERKCECGGTCSMCQTGEPENEYERLQMKADGPGSLAPDLVETPPVVHEVLRSQGQPLDPATRAFMEARFGQDFSGVRVHRDTKAAQSAKAVHARAYAVGRDVVFASNQFSPASPEGRRLLAHELAHTVQQRKAGTEHSGLERARGGEANRAAGPAFGGASLPALTRSGVALACQPSDEGPNTEWIDGQIALVNQQLQTPLLPPPLKATLLLQLRKLQMQRARSVPGVRATPAPTDPALRRCVLFGNHTPDPATIDAKLAEVELAKVKLWTAVNTPGAITYGLVAPQLRALELLKIQLLECAVSVGPRSISYARQAQESLNRVAVQLGERQAERRKFWDADKHGHDEMTALDLHEETHVIIGGWGKKETNVLRDPMISTIEHELYKNAEARRVYEEAFGEIMNAPEEESMFHKVVAGFLCKNLAPCKENMEQIHADLDSGMSLNEVRMRALVRLAPMLIASETGPGDLVPIGEGPASIPFGVPVPETGGVKPEFAPDPIPPAPSKTGVMPEPPPAPSASDSTAETSPTPTADLPENTAAQSSPTSTISDDPIDTTVTTQAQTAKASSQPPTANSVPVRATKDVVGAFLRGIRNADPLPRFSSGGAPAGTNRPVPAVVSSAPPTAHLAENMPAPFRPTAPTIADVKPDLPAFAPAQPPPIVESSQFNTPEQYLDALRSAPTSPTLAGPAWDHTRFPRGPRRAWTAGDPIDMPSSRIDKFSGRGTYPSGYLGRFWRNRADIELKLRAQGTRDVNPNSTDPISAMSEADLITLRGTPTGDVRSPRDPSTGRAMEIEHLGVAQRIGARLEQVGFSASEARRLSGAASPKNLLDVSPVEHAFFDAYARRVDPSGNTWDLTGQSDSRLGRPLEFMSDEAIAEIVIRGNTDPRINLSASSDLAAALRVEISARGLPLVLP